MTEQNVGAMIQQVRREIASLKERKARLEGRRESLLTRLKGEFGIEGLDDAWKYKADLDGVIAEDEKKLAEMEVNLVDQITAIEEAGTDGKQD